ncbi:MAG: hypothetical protein WCP77_06020, partial [Roseococcus sp.]
MDDEGKAQGEAVMERHDLGLTRRAALAAPLLAGLASPAAAQQPTLVEIGTDGWLFPVWDRVGRVDMVALRASIQTVTQAIGVLRAAQIQVAICLIPSKKRLMRQFLPPGTQIVPEAAQRYSLTIAEAARAGAVAPDLDAVFRAQLQREPGRNLFFRTD